MPTPAQLLEWSQACQLSAQGKAASIERGNQLVNGKARYPAEQIERDRHLGRSLQEAAKFLKGMAEQ